jgi:hypothetical protein
VPSASVPSPIAIDDLFAYQRDLWERSILFWNTLRQRADNMLAHERAGKPPLLDFDYELVLDARRFERPVNYALPRITRYADGCLEDCLDPAKAPLIIIDPRAGHGPGIGGFKRDSEVGIALHEGYPIYFVVFYPEPSPGQTVRDVLHVFRRFVADVSKRHEGRPPILYGNCQAGWAITILAADREGLVGPAVLNGSPLSYWAGKSGVNPARVAGGLLGGGWLPHLAADRTDMAIEASDVTLIKGSLMGVVTAIEISRATKRNVRQNLVGAFGYNTLGIPVAMGVLYPFIGLLLSPLIAAAAMALSSVTVVSNANRLRLSEPRKAPS